MNWWPGNKQDSNKQAADRNARAARRTIAALPLVLSSDEEDRYEDCDTSLLFETDGTNDPVDEEPSGDTVDEEAAMVDAAAAAAAELARQKTLPFEDANYASDPDSWKKELKVKFDPSDVKYSFNIIESQLRKFGINSQWEKKDALVTVLPAEIIEEVKPILRLDETEQGPHIYKDLKAEIVQLYGPKPEEAFKKAMALKMTGKPSAFGKQLLHIICPGSKPLDGCHCDKMVFGFWDAQLSPAIRTKLAGMTFDKNTYQNMFKIADQAFLANGGHVATPAVVGAVSTPPQDETLQVAAAATRGGARGRGGRGRGGRGRGNNSSANSTASGSASASSGSSGTTSKPHQKGTKHSDLPSSAGWACAQHWKKGRQAPYCSDPLVCKWVNIVAPRTSSST